jgi:hypothetical protein
VQFFESMSPSDAQRMDRIYAPDAWFKDPFNEVRGVRDISRIFAHMFEQVDAPRFVVTEALAAAGFALAGALRSTQLPRLSFADAAQVLELGPRELAGIAAGLRRGEGLALAGLLRADGEALARRPLPELP